MDPNKMREQFEKRFPVPPGVEWRDGAYHICKPRQITLAGHLFYLGRWESWQASREAVVVELPPKISAHNTTEGGFVRPEAEHYDEAIDDCREAIEAQGLKVAP